MNSVSLTLARSLTSSVGGLFPTGEEEGKERPEMRGASASLTLAGIGGGTGRESGMPRSGKDLRTLWTLQLAQLPKLVSGPVPRFPVLSTYFGTGLVTSYVRAKYFLAKVRK